MCIIDRYISRSLFLAFLGSLFVFLFLYIVIDLLSRLDEILKNKIPISVLKDYYLSFLPVIFYRIAPVASLLSVLYTLGRLNRDNEILALRSLGFGILKITKPVILFGLTISIFVFFVNERFTYLTQRKSEEIKKVYFSKAKSEKHIRNLAFLGENRLYFIQNFYPEEKRIEGLTILEQNENLDLKERVFAEKGVFQKNLWILYRSFRYRFSEDGSILGRPIYFDEEISDIRETPQDILRQRISPAFMNIKDLSGYIERLKRAKAETVVKNFKVDFYDRFASPFTSLVIIFTGIPFAVSVRKKRIEFFSFGICVVLSFFYYVISSISLSLGKAGLIPPFLSAWLAHLLFLSFGIYLIYRST